MWKILIIDQNVAFTGDAVELLCGPDKRAIAVHDAEAAMQRLKGEQFHLIIIRDDLPDDGSYKLLEFLMMIDETIPVILVLSQHKLEDFRDIIRPYTWSVFEGDFSIDSLMNATQNVIDHIKLNHKIRYLAHQQKYIFKFDNIVGVSQKFQEVLSLVKKIAKSDSIVLIQGETGTGKELIAAALHYNSNRCQENFVAVNCAALNENLLESELFGHEKGAFTGAHNLRIGRFEQANCGTLFLDEIGEMCLSVQAKVLRVIENQEFERVGSSKTIKVDVRVIAATNRDLAREVREGRFRQDLFYRLSVIPITIPPLRERKDDIVPLTMFFFNKYKGKGGRSLVGFHPECLRMLEEYSWPGNVRELENVIERSILIANNENILPDDLLISKNPQDRPILKMDDRSDDHAHNPTFSIQIPPEGMNLKSIERALLVQALKMSGGVQMEAARLLGISSRVINYKIKKLKLHNEKSLG
ncbi:MAG: sigma 54-interacting transcriptional regulator [bacterium]